MQNLYELSQFASIHSDKDLSQRQIPLKKKKKLIP